jgi:MFS family permease
MIEHAVRRGAILLLVSSLTVMAGATIAPALPAMQRHFDASNLGALWIRLVLTIPALSIVVAAPLAGMLVDRVGRLKLLVPAMALYGLAGSSGLYLDSLFAILVGRALLGVSVAGVMTCATTLLADYFEGSARARLMGWQSSFMSLGGVAFLTGGGLLADLGWRLPFLVYLVAFALIPPVLWGLTEPDRPSRASLVSHSGEELVAAPFRLMAAVYTFSLVAMLIFYIIPTQVPFYLADLLNAAPSASGMAIAVATLFAAVTALLYGQVRSRIGFVSILGLCFALMGTGYLIIGNAGSYVAVLSGLAVCGLGMGMTFPNLTVWLTSEVPASLRGRALGGLTTAIFLGQFLSPIASQPLAPVVGLHNVFRLSGLVLLLLATLLVVLRRPLLAMTLSPADSDDATEHGRAPAIGKMP